MQDLQNLQEFRVSRYGRTELTEVPGTGMNVIHDSQKFRVSWRGRTETHRSSGQVKKCCTRIPGIVTHTGIHNIHNIQKFRVRV